MAAIADAGMGSPVKFFLESISKSSSNFARLAMTLYRTSLKTPQTEKMMAAVVMRNECSVPGGMERLFRTMTEGPTPKVMASARESNSPPNSLSAFMARATAPSRRSAKAASRRMPAVAVSSCEVVSPMPVMDILKMTKRPHDKPNAVITLGSRKMRRF